MTWRFFAVTGSQCCCRLAHSSGNPLHSCCGISRYLHHLPIPIPPNFVSTCKHVNKMSEKTNKWLD